MNTMTLTLLISTAFLLTACGGGGSEKSVPTTAPVTKVTTPKTQLTESNLAVGVLNMSDKVLDFNVDFSKDQDNVTIIGKTVFGVPAYTSENDVFVSRVNEALNFTISTPGHNQLEITSLDSNTKESVSEKIEKTFQSTIEASSQYVVVAYPSFDSALNEPAVHTSLIKLNNTLEDTKSIEIDIFNFTGLEQLSYRVNCSSGTAMDVIDNKETPHETISCPSGQDLVSVSIINKGAITALEYSFVSGSKYSLIAGQNNNSEIISQLINKQSF